MDHCLIPELLAEGCDQSNWYFDTDYILPLWKRNMLVFLDAAFEALDGRARYLWLCFMVAAYIICASGVQGPKVFYAKEAEARSISSIHNNK